MRRLLAALALLAAGSIAGPAAPARASSTFAIGGLGEPQLEETARIRAMGGAGAAEHGPREISYVNPASLADVDHFLLEGTVLPEYRRVSAPGLSTETVRGTTFPSARAIIALPLRLVLGASYVAGTDATFHAERAESTGALARLQVDGTGGMNFLRVTLARRITPSFRLGADYEVIAGSFRESWLRTFSAAGLAPARDSVVIRYPKKSRFRFGAQVVNRAWSAGAAFETSQSLPLDLTRSTVGAQVVRDDGRLRLPTGFALGLSAPVRGRIRAVAQYRRANWGPSSLTSDLVTFRAQQRFSLGLERRRGDDEGTSFKGRLPLRAGVYYLQWPDLLPVAGAADIHGGTAGVNEVGVTLGAGIVTKDKGGSLDLSLEAGSRGNESDLGLSERFLRLGISVLVSDETWKGSLRR